VGKWAFDTSIWLTYSKGTAPVVARFYSEMLAGCSVTETQQNDSACSSLVCVGPGVQLIFVEEESIAADSIQAMEGVHVCCYADDFEGLYGRFLDKDAYLEQPKIRPLL
jgi:hypothetical protein